MVVMICTPSFDSMIDRKIQNYVHACILCQLYTVTMTLTWAIYYVLMELVAIFELGHNTSIKATKLEMEVGMVGLKVYKQE